MTIIVEDGSIVTNANSYCSEDDLTAYALARGVTLTASEDQLLIQSMDYIEAQSYQGVKATREQSLQWPRTSVYIDGYDVGTREIPVELTNAQLVTCIAIDSGNDPLAVVEPGVKREKVDVIEVEYQDGAMSAAYDPKVQSALKKLLGGSGSALNFTVTRA